MKEFFARPQAALLLIYRVKRLDGVGFSAAIDTLPEERDLVEDPRLLPFLHQYAPMVYGCQYHH